MNSLRSNNLSLNIKGVFNQVANISGLENLSLWLRLYFFCIWFIVKGWNGSAIEIKVKNQYQKIFLKELKIIKIYLISGFLGQVPKLRTLLRVPDLLCSPHSSSVTMIFLE